MIKAAKLNSYLLSVIFKKRGTSLEFAERRKDFLNTIRENVQQTLAKAQLCQRIDEKISV